MAVLAWQESPLRAAAGDPQDGFEETAYIAPGFLRAISMARLEPGTAARIFTGAPLPEGADAVVMQEQAEPVDTATPSRSSAATRNPLPRSLNSRMAASRRRAARCS